MRNISFSLTIGQFKARTKTVTRRLGWKFLKEGDTLMACEKCMGLKTGEKIIHLGKIRVVSVRRESLADMIFDPIYKEVYGNNEAKHEGFTGMSGAKFVQMFCKHMKCNPTD